MSGAEDPTPQCPNCHFNHFSNTPEEGACDPTTGLVRAGRDCRRCPGWRAGHRYRARGPQFAVWETTALDRPATAHLVGRVRRVRWVEVVVKRLSAASRMSQVGTAGQPADLADPHVANRLLGHRSTQSEQHPAPLHRLGHRPRRRLGQRRRPDADGLRRHLWVVQRFWPAVAQQLPLRAPDDDNLADGLTIEPGVLATRTGCGGPARCTELCDGDGPRYQDGLCRDLDDPNGRHQPGTASSTSTSCRCGNGAVSRGSGTPTTPRSPSRATTAKPGRQTRDRDAQPCR